MRVADATEAVRRTSRRFWTPCASAAPPRPIFFFHLSRLWKPRSRLEAKVSFKVTASDGHSRLT